MLRNIMNDQRKALGKGLGSLIPMSTSLGRTEGPAQEGKKVYFECPIEDIITNPNQPRKLFAKEAIDELAASIEEKGILQPLIVRPLGGGKYELIAGERRYRAARQTGLHAVPVIVKETDESETLEIALIENIQRQDLNPIEESLAYKELLSRYQYTQDDLAKKLGKDRSSIANSLRLLKLPDRIRDYLIGNQISMGHARALLALENKELQMQVATDIISNNLSVREVEVLTKKLKEHDVDTIREKNETGTEKELPAKDYGSLVRRLEDNLRCKVFIKNKGAAGQITFNYHNEAELNTLVDKLLS